MSGRRNTERQQRRQAIETSAASSPAPSLAESIDSRRGSVTASTPTSPTDSTFRPQQIDFQFLNFSHPSEAKTGKTRKAVRSHVTKQQHQRENAAAAARRAKTQHMDERPLTLLQLATSSSSDLGQGGSTEPSQGSRSSTAFDTSEVPSPSPSPSLSPISATPRRLDLTEIYPEDWHPYVGRIMEHYISKLAVDSPDLDSADEPGLLRTRFLPFVMTDSASVHALMLLAAAHFARTTGSRSHTIDLLQLRGLAIREINTALEDQTRAFSDQVIAAVAEMASYEALFGDRSIFNTHMTGLLRLVSLRGGLPALGLDGLLERILLWIDANASFITGSHIYFDKAAFPTTAVHPKPDPARFSGGLV